MQQQFERVGGHIRRRVLTGNATHETVIADFSDAGSSPNAGWWQSFLRAQKYETSARNQTIRIVDAFCGSGGLGLGATLAAEALGRRVDFATIIDTDGDAASVHRLNLGGRRQLSDSVASTVDYHILGLGDGATFGYSPEVVHSDLARVGQVDMLIAGPPCQGHSNLNNYTRREDPRNDLYLTTVALGVGLGAKAIVIENVPTVQNSHSEVVTTAAALLKSQDYGVSMYVLRADKLGAAQRRARHFLIAAKGCALAADHLRSVAEDLAAPAMPLSWAIKDLLDREPDHLMDTPPTPTPTNAARINYLFDQNIYDLPDDQRPECHQNGTSYTAVYGRMHWDRPAQTITTGFGTPGQGRYVHPQKRRLITPREAARIQGFPDWYDFAPKEFSIKRKHLAKWIGDAVHPVLGYTAALAALAAIS